MDSGRSLAVASRRPVLGLLTCLWFLAPVILTPFGIFDSIGCGVRADEPRGADLHRRHFVNAVSNRRDNGDMLQLFRPWASQTGGSVVQVVVDGTPVCLGMVVSKEGFVLTKRSELSGDPIRVRLPDSRLIAARVSAVRRESDLALLKIDAAPEDLTPIEFATSDELPIGSFLFSVGRGGSPIGLGAVSARERTINHQGRLGMFLVDSGGQATVGSVWPASGAAVAGVKEGDRIIAIDGRNETNRVRVIETLRERFPGESVRLTIDREGETMDLIAKIQDVGMMQESENDLRVNGPRSIRLSGFERVIQHDTVINPDQCGGPLVDTKGRIIGMNIARAGRVVSYALPATLLRASVDRMLAEIKAAPDEN